MFNRISLQHPILDSYTVIKDNSEPEWLLENLSHINIFIGTNNSGKSRLLRELFSREDFQYEPCFLNVNRFKDDFKDVLISLESSISPIDPTTKQSFIDSINNFKNTYVPYYFHLSSTYSKGDFEGQAKGLISTIKNLGSSILAWLKRYRRNNEANLLDKALKTFLDKYENVYDTYKPKDFNLSRYYIPILRSLKNFEKKGENYVDFFNEKTIEHYFREKDGVGARYSNYLPDTIFTGLKFYDQLKFIRGEAQKTREKQELFEKFLSESFFDNQRVQLTAGNAGKILIMIGSEERPVEMLGDGIQSIIILTYQLFMNQGNRSIFFFEEPEIHLHPGYQRLFIETLRRKEFRGFQYFISTHSNHFLDITLEDEYTSVFTFEKELVNKGEPKFKITNVAFGNDNILRLIGANKSSVFLSNCTIWVEGITDRMYLRHYIDLYQQQDLKIERSYKEDYHYSFVEYGGTNITHWSFLDDVDEITEVNGKKIVDSRINIKRLCSISFVVTDSDNATDDSEKKKRQKKLKRLLTDKQFYCLKSREVENLLTKEIVINTLKSYDNELEDKSFDNFIENFNTTDKISEQILSNVPDFKPAIINKKNKNFYKKTEFANSAIEQIKTYDDMSNEAKLLVKKLYEFIKEQNKK